MPKPTGELVVLTRWFSFGVGHAHHVAGRTYDPSTIVQITAPDPRAIMLAWFGQTWSMEYNEPPTPEQQERYGWHIVDLPGTQHIEPTPEEHVPWND